MIDPAMTRSALFGNSAGESLSRFVWKLISNNWARPVISSGSSNVARAILSSSPTRTTSGETTNWRRSKSRSAKIPLHPMYSPTDRRSMGPAGRFQAPYGITRCFGLTNKGCTRQEGAMKSYFGITWSPVRHWLCAEARSAGRCRFRAVGFTIIGWPVFWRRLATGY
jgi:hypothetical protein